MRKDRRSHGDEETVEFRQIYDEAPPISDFYPVRGIYNRTPESSLPPGLYLGLMHGRIRPTDELNDWGFNGPIIGPLKYVHTTYAASIRLAAQDGAELEDIDIVDSLVAFDGKLYGDWTVFIVESRESKSVHSEQPLRAPVRKARKSLSGAQHCLISATRSEWDR